MIRPRIPRRTAQTFRTAAPLACLLFLAAGFAPAPAPNAPGVAGADAASIYRACIDACAGGRLDEADRLLLDAIKAGFDDFSRIQREPALTPLRERPIYRAIFAARDAADPMLAQRAVRAWQARLHDDRYTLEPDDARRLNLLTPLPAPARREMRGRVGRVVDHLSATIFPAGLRHAVLIVLLAPDDAAGMFPHPQIRGVYRHPNHTLITLDAGRALRHEIVHALHHADMDARGQDHAAWVMEGIACLYEHFSIDASGRASFAPSDRDDLVRRLAARGRLLDWPVLLAMDTVEFEADAARTYAQARSMMRFVASRHGVEAWYEAYVEQHDLDETGRLALEWVFDAPLESIEADWRTWITSEASVTMPAALGHDSYTPADDAPLEVVSTPPPPPSPPRTVARSLHEAAQEAYGTGEYVRAARLLRRVVELEPTHARARYDLGLACVRLHDHPAARAQHAALARLDPSLAGLLGNLLR